MSYKLLSQEGATHLVQVNVCIKDCAVLLDKGSTPVIDRLFPGMQTRPEPGFDFAVTIDCDAHKNSEAMLKNISEIKRNLMSGPLELAFTNLLAGKKDGPVTVINYRKSEKIFVCPSGGKVAVIFLVSFEDITDKALAKVFLQEFVEAQRSLRSAPPVGFSKEPPRELAGVTFTQDRDSIGFISFSFEDRHVQGPKLQSAITNLAGFRSYILYHIKCSKTYLHMRMRKKVDSWLLVLNRAVPEVETEKKTAAGKTFTRK